MKAMSDRNANGTFRTGHRLSHGNPFSKQLCEMRSLLYARVTPEEFHAILDRMIALAQDGNVPAAKLLIEHLCGKPVQAVQVSGADGEKLSGLSVEDVQLAVIEALADDKSAKERVAAKMKELYERVARPRFSPGPCDSGGAD
jgi:hypothetical protein